LSLDIFGVQVQVPKIQIGTAIGNYVGANVHGGGTIVKAADTAIDVVKNANLQPGTILVQAGQAGVAAAAASVKQQVNDSVSKSSEQQALAGITGNAGILIAIAILAGFLLLRRGKG